MSTTQQSLLHKADDATWIEIFEKILYVLNEHSPDIKYYIADGLQDKNKYDDKKVCVGRFSFTRANVTIDKSTNNHKRYVIFTLTRNIELDGRKQPSTLYDGATIYFEPNAQLWDGISDEIIKINQIIASYGNPSLSPTQGYPEDEYALKQLIMGFGASHQQMLSSLNGQLEELAQRRTQLESDFRKKEEERTQTHEAALNELDKQRQEMLLESHRSERRRLLQDTINGEAANLRKNMTSGHARAARWAVFITALLLSVTAGYFAIESIILIGGNTGAGPATWYLLARSVISSFIAIGGLAYAASWLRSFYTEEVEAARSIDRFNYDMIRASWAIETFLEVKKEHQVDMPVEWIQSVTRGLFEGATNESGLDEGTRALRALMGFTASGSFGPNGAQIDINRKGARGLSKANEDEEK